MTKTYARTDDAIAKLSPEQFRVTQQNGTERPFTGEYNDTKAAGIYVDIVSGEPLFASSDKFEKRLRLAELHQADRAGPCGRTARCQPRHGAHRGALQSTATVT